MHEGGESDVIKNDKNIKDEYEDKVEDDDDEGDHIEEMEGLDDHDAKQPRIF